MDEQMKATIAKKERERVETNLVVRSEDGSVDLDATLDKRRAYIGNMEATLKDFYLDLEEKELRHRLFLKNPKYKNHSFVFEDEEQEWLDFEKKKISRVFVMEIEKVKEDIEFTEEKLKVVRTIVGL